MEIAGRLANLRAMMMLPAFRAAHGQALKEGGGVGQVPMLVAGDFNVPSHLDWSTPDK